MKIGRLGKDSTDLRFHEIIEGNLVQMLEAVQVQLNYRFLTRPVKFVGMQRIEKNQYPIDALREMLLNVLVHRTYMGASIQLRVYDDRLSIWNEGTLPFGLSLEDLKVEHNSRPRNPKIAEACFLAGYIDTWGRGTLKIINACKEAGLPIPELTEKNGGVEVTLYNKEESNQVSNQGGQASGAIGSAIGGTIGDITDRQKEVLDLIIHDNKISIRGIAKKLGINYSAAQEHIDKLIIW